MRLLFVFLLAFAAGLARADQKTIVVLGDSIASGSGVDLEEAFPAVLGAKIRAADLPWRVINAGVSGDTTAGGARRINWVMRNPMDILLVELGGNDGLRGVPPEETAKNLQRIIDQAREKYPEVQIVIAGMRMADNMGEDYNKAFTQVFKDAARANRAVLIPFLLEGVGGKPELNQPDRIHPTPEGHRIVAQTVWEYLRPLLEKSSSSTSETTRVTPAGDSAAPPGPPSRTP